MFGLVDNEEILVDFTNENYRLPNKSTVEYRLIDKQSLIQIQFQYRTQIFEYFITSKAKISTIIHRFIDDNQSKTLSKDNILGFFDEYGKCINDEILTNVKKTILISVIEIILTDCFCELTLNKEAHLFNPITKWQQIDCWLKTFLQQDDSSIVDYAFILKTDKLILDDNQVISSIIDENQSQSIDVVNRNITTKVIVSSNNQTSFIYVLKSTNISSVLNNPNILRQLNFDKISIDDCRLILENGDESNLSEEQPLSVYLTDENQTIQIRISNYIRIIKYDDGEQMKISLSNPNLTIEELLKLTEKSLGIYKYLASNQTKRIFNSNEIISNLNQTKYLLVKENETFLVSIENQDDNKEQRYLNFAAVDEIMKDNQIDISQHNLLYADDFIPSADIQLTALQSDSTIRFKLINGNLPAKVTVENTEDNRSIQFNCSRSMTVKRLQMISIQLFMIDSDYYCLSQDDSTLDDDAIALEDFDSDQIEYRFQMKCNAPMKCSIKYSEQIIILPCDDDTLISKIIEQSFKLLQISSDDMNTYELIALTDDQTQIDSALSVGDIKESFSDSTTLPFQLKKKDI